MYDEQMRFPEQSPRQLRLLDWAAFVSALRDWLDSPASSEFIFTRDVEGDFWVVDRLYHASTRNYWGPFHPVEEVEFARVLSISDDRQMGPRREHGWHLYCRLFTEQSELRSARRPPTGHGGPQIHEALIDTWVDYPESEWDPHAGEPYPSFSADRPFWNAWLKARPNRHGERVKVLRAKRAHLGV